MPITIEQAFAELHSLGVREPLRRFQPKVMLVAVNEDDTVVKYEKLKRAPEVEDLHRFGDDCKGTSIFIANTESFSSIGEFQKVVLQNARAIRNRKRKTKNALDV